MKKFVLITGIFLLGISLCVKSQSISIDSTFTSDGEIFPFSQVDSIYGLSLSGHVTLNSDTSLVRVILVDENFDEYMVYEAYPLIVTSLDFDITNVSDETKYLNKTEPYSMMIYLVNAELDLSSILYQAGCTENTDSLQAIYKNSIESQKVSNIDNFISNNHMIWFANITPVSNKSFSEKKAMFGGGKYNLFGLDYYTGGVFSRSAPNETSIDNSPLVKNFDWRNRHGANDPDKINYYYDGDELGGGWLTSIKNQSSG